MGLSGIPWWTTDIGGFKNGDINSPSFRELIVRWFQFGVFCPVFRLHGIRQPGTLVGSEQTGAANEVWSFGETEYEIIRHLLFLRERLRPYVMEQMTVAHSTGLPPMRPLFLDFPADPACWDLALKRKSLQHALKTELSELDRAGLESFRATLQPVSEKEGSTTDE